MRKEESVKERHFTESAWKLWPDVIRVLATFFVVYIHSNSVSLDKTMPSLMSLMLFAITKTSVPLYAMLSGALLLTKNDSLKVFYKKRTSKIIPPWIFWSIFFVLWTIFFRQAPVASIGDLIHYFYVGLLTGLWFLPIIIGLYMVTPVIKLVIVHRYHLIYPILFMWFILFSIIPYLGMQFTSPYTIFQLGYSLLAYSGYFIFGYVQTKFKVCNLNRSIYVLFAGLSFTMGNVLLSNTLETKDFQIFEYLSPGTVITAVGTFAFVQNFLSDKEYGKSYFYQILRHISTVSLGILFAHQFIIESIRKFTSPHLEFVTNNVFLLGGIVFLISLLMVSLLVKVFRLKGIIT